MTPKRVAAHLLVMLLSIAAIGAGCGGGGTRSDANAETRTATTVEPVGPCGDASFQGVKVPVRGGDSFDAALLGKGGVGVVFGHQLHDNFCSWLPFAQKVASRGMVALAVNFPSTRHLDAYLLAAVDELRRDGVTKIILVGASMGGTGALVAAAEEKDVAGVASVSGPELFSDLNALPAVRKIKIPLLFLVARQDASFAADARRLYRAASSRAKRLLVTSGSEHGADLISADPRAERALLRFIEQVAA